jgi:NitT/TauT family transport system substrate-binding protein
MDRRIVQIVVVLVFIAAITAACAPVVQPVAAPPAASGVASAEAAPPTPATVRVSVAPFLSYAAFYVALEEGYFAEQGLDIEISQLTRASDAIPALAQGQLDVAGLNVTAAFLNAIVRGSSMRMVAPMNHDQVGECGTNAAVIRPEVLATLSTPPTSEELLSLRYYVTTAAISTYAIDTFLNTYGISFDEVTLVDISGGASVLEPLQQDRLDVAWQVEPWITRAEASGAGVTWFTLAELVGDTQTSIVAFGPTLLNDNPDVGERFVAAYLKGARQFAEGKTARNLDIIEKFTELDRDLLESMCFPQISGDGVVLTDSIERFTQWAAERDLMDAPLVAADFYEPRFVEAARLLLDGQ